MKQFKFFALMLAMIAGVNFLTSCGGDDDDFGNSNSGLTGGYWMQYDVTDSEVARYKDIITNPDNYSWQDKSIYLEYGYGDWSYSYRFEKGNTVWKGFAYHVDDAGYRSAMNGHRGSGWENAKLVYTKTIRGITIYTYVLSETPYTYTKADNKIITTDDDILTIINNQLYEDGDSTPYIHFK